MQGLVELNIVMRNLIELATLTNVKDNGSVGSFSPSICELIKIEKGKKMSRTLVLAIEREKPILEIVKWVLNQIEVISKFLGLSFEGHEQHAWALFTTLERDGLERGINKFYLKTCREMKNLECGVNYKRNGSSVGRKGVRTLQGF